MALCVEMGLEYFVTDMLVLTGRAVKNLDDIKLTASEYSEFYDLVEEAAADYSGKITIIAPFPPGKRDLKDLCQDQERGPEYLVHHYSPGLLPAGSAFALYLWRCSRTEPPAYLG